MSSQTATILVTDLVGSTELRVRLGEEQADELRRTHDDMLTAAVTAHGGTVVKGLGDGVLAMFSGTADAVSAAVEAQQQADQHGRRDPGRALSIRVGISAGDVSIEEGDCFGTPVIEASRLCAAAEGGQVLAADVVEVLARGRGGHRYEPAGELELKGLPDPVRAVTVVWEAVAAAGADQPPFPPLLHDAGAVPFVGRIEAVEQMTELWKTAASGERRCALLSGEPGVGKTRLSSEVARLAHDQGAVVLLGRCDEELGLPYQPFVEALAYFAANASPTADALGRHPADLARLSPDLAVQVPGLGEPMKADPDAERHRLFEATTSWLAAAAEPAGLVLVLDDIHWAGKPTLLLLRHLLRSSEPSRLFVIGTYRDTDLDRTHPLSELLADLRREPGVERVDLAGLSTAEVEAFVAAAAGEELDDAKRALAAAVHAETEGNAFFVGEVLRNLAESGAIVQVDGAWQAAVSMEDMAIPEGVREVIGRRVSRLSEDVEQVLRWASVIGRDVDLAVLVGAAELDEEAVLTSLDEAIDARLMEEAGPGRYRFVHALVRSTLLEEVRTTRRVRMHLRIAEATEQCRPDDVMALAHHFQEAATAGGLDKAIAYSLGAGRQAFESSAFDQAVQLFQQGLDLLEDTGEDDPDQRLDLLIGLGTAHFALGDGAHDATLTQAADLARSLGDGERMGIALTEGHRGWNSASWQVNEPYVERLAAALDLLPQGRTSLRALLLAIYALELAPGDDPRVHDLAAQSLAMARSVADAENLSRVLSYALWHVYGDPLRREEYLSLVAELMALAERTADRSAELSAQAAHVNLAMQAGDTALLAEQVARFADLGADLGTAAARWQSAFQRSGLALMVGDHAAAEAYAEESLRVGEELGQADVFQFYGNIVTALRRQQGRSEEVLDLARTVVDSNQPGHDEWCAWFSLLLTEAGDLDEGRARFDIAFPAYVGHRPDFALVPSGATLAHAAADLGQREAAEHLLEVLEPASGLTASWLPLSSLGPVDLALGRLLLTLDRPAEAAERLAASAEMCERGGMPPFLASTRLAQGEVALALGDPEGARARFEEALALAEVGGFGCTERRSRAALEALS